MEHIEYAGIHSGDSACVIPTISISEENLKTINDYTGKIARELNVVGLMNIQYAIADGRVYVLEANPRASRTVPIVSKVCNISMARLATEIIMGKSIVRNLVKATIPHFGVKEAVFPFNMFHEVDPLLGPEMRSTGEVLGIAGSFGLAYYKAQEATQMVLPASGTVLISVREQDRPAAVAVARKFVSLGFNVLATEGTNRYLNQNGVSSAYIKKLHEGRPNILDSVTNREINLIINTPIGRIGEIDDSYIRKAAIKYKIPYITTLAAAMASVKGIEAYKLAETADIKHLQAYHSEIR
jgi:carbamoyl-phosphate synthase large subunit